MLSSPPPFFFFNDTATTEIYTLSLHDALPILGILAALNRVYINIGVYSEEWTRHFNPFFGGKPITPVEIAAAEQNSAYWRATELGTGKMAAFLLKAGQPDTLAYAPCGKAYQAIDAVTLDRRQR